LPFIAVNGTRLFYRLEGNGDLPVLVLSHSLGCDHSMWEPQMPDLLEHFQVLRYDTRGHGSSGAPAGDYSLEHLGRDVVELAGALNIGKFSFCGLSMGGAVGQWLALNAPGRLSALVLANTSPQFGTRETWEARIQAVQQGGMPAIVDAVMGRFFSPERLAGPYAQSTRRTFLGADPTGYVSCCAALRDVNYKTALGKIAAPTLVIGSRQDPSTPWEGNGDLLASGIPGAKAVVLKGAHLSNLEQPRSFSAAVLEFLLATAQPEQDSFQAGMQVRRQVLGAEHVDRAMASASDFNRDFQELITRYAWGNVWTRPGLDHRTRRLLVLAITSSLGRWEEFRLHLRAGLQHGLEPADVKEVLLQAAVYAGVPAANTAFTIAKELIEEMERQSS
jgi:3-oxoadipate enol-lactonase/4-carboxymuconolactone decarboxylase